VDNHPHVEAEIELADGERLRGACVVDVGSSLPLGLTGPFVDRHRLRERTGTTMQRPAGGGVGGPAVADVGRVRALRIGGAEVADVVTVMFGENAGVFSGNASWIGNVGSDVLRRFLVFLDYERRRMILEPHAGSGEPFETDMSGANFVTAAGDRELLVEFVLPGSPADAAGLRQGDLVTATDGRSIEPRSLLELRARLRRAGERVRLTIRRGNEAQVVELTTRRIV
jgi:hypothetical protein